jgi:methionyl-tRNA formyltransferase
MKVLFLGDKENKLITFLKSCGEDVLNTSEKIDPGFLLEHQVEFVVSYGYRHIIRQAVLDVLPGRIINLHISYLPWNRGADPNFWSAIDDTPKGVSIHQVDAGLDTGPILLQKQVVFSDDESLRSSYALLSDGIEHLFMNHWPELRNLTLKPVVQQGIGSYHKSVEKEMYIADIREKWLDMPISELKAYAADVQLSLEHSVATNEEIVRRINSLPSSVKTR